MNTIEIISSDGSKEGRAVWMAKHSDNETVKLFGTDTIPTPFFTIVPRGEVVRIIQGLNPDYRVI
jgi:hypothetical protein